MRSLSAAVPTGCSRGPFIAASRTLPRATPAPLRHRVLPAICIALQGFAEGSTRVKSKRQTWGAAHYVL